LKTDFGPADEGIVRVKEVEVSESSVVSQAGESVPSVYCGVAPARVNLLGEHTDYTGGLVLPMAIPFYTEASIEVRAEAQGAKYEFHSEQFASEPTLARLTEDAGVTASGMWSDYPMGVLVELRKSGIDVPAFSLTLKGNVPFGAGLSSSASVEVASCMAMLAAAGASLSTAEIALLCQRAENQFVGSPCGIMDQFVITAAKAGHALLVDTRTLETELIPMNGGALANTSIVVCNSMVKHSIAEGGYGDRRREVEAGERVLREAFPGLRDLGAATVEQLAACRDSMSDEEFRRCRHIITENARVRAAREVMLAGDPAGLGELMLKAHASQRDDFACSCDEVDFLVESAVQLRGCFGARLTGGGFGGCTVNLVERAQAAAFSQALTAAYKQAFGIQPEAYVCEAVDGAVSLAAAAAKGNR
jgi:galactokinase